MCKYPFTLPVFLLLIACGGLGDSTDSENFERPSVDLASEAFYDFDEPSERLIDGSFVPAFAFNSVEDLFHGEIVAASRSVGKLGDALYFGQDLPSYVRFDPFLADDNDGSPIDINVGFPLNAVSIEAWVMFESLDPELRYQFFGNSPAGLSSFNVEVVESQFRMVLFGPTEQFEIVRSNASFGLDIWYHIAVTYNQSTARVYVNGELNATTRITGEISPLFNSVFLGGTPNDPASRSFPGYIDELRFAQFERADFEIRAYVESTQ